ncbi:DUF4386 domain-containing protein [Cyclobacterium sp. 1_MG-2023]|uniref:DUF4386 domain-containing protein n=1 Tax=Cyclobacterium sp. 1_MG-2023 TaxID=3062681 RepID=UPI0026E2B017|nr:DUF4386 domain-containing protein [Cyclobacterium sp. 1_MG-2023]MDO6438447.1 DUF4386 domain-containing protein [Cyclobacterium sp. 1_MG-2023]
MYFSKRTYGVIAGASILTMAIIAMFSYGYVFEKLIVKGDPIETFNNLKSSYNIFVTGIIGWAAILLLDVLVAWSLHHFFKELNPGLSLLTAMLRIVYSMGLAYAIFQLVPIVPLLGSPTERYGLVLMKIKSFELIWSKSLIIFGFHLIGLGFVVSKVVNNFNKFGYLIVFAGLCYVLLNLVKVTFPSLAEGIVMAELILSLPMAMAEIGLGFWLLTKGRKAYALNRKELLI